MAPNRGRSVSQTDAKNASVSGCRLVFRLATITWCRLSRRRVLTTCLTLLLCVCLLVSVDQQLHPDSYLPSSTRLSALDLHAFSWLDLTSGHYFRSRRKVLSPLPDLLTYPSRPCRPSSFLVAIVPSPPGDSATRRVIRGTWGGAISSRRWPGVPGPLPAASQVFFVLGTSRHADLARRVQQEAEEHDDLIVGDFHDSYRNLTLKTLAGLSWVSRRCSGTRFVMKVDQDTLVDFPRLLHFLLRHQSSLRNAVVGKLYYDSQRLNSGKWKVSALEYPFSRYPTFAGGPCYLISTEAVPRMVNASRFLPSLSMEDVQVTGIVAQAAGVSRLHMQQLRNWYHGESLCVFLQRDKYQVSLTELSRDKLQHVWRVLTSGTCLPYRPQGKVTA